LEFNLVNLKIIVRTANPARLSRLLAESGTDFTNECKSIACNRHAANCKHCPERGGCAWYSVFSQALAVDPVALKRHQKPPLPFVFSFPLSADATDAPGILECRLVVIGQAIPHLEMLMEGFSKLLESDDCDVPADIISFGSLDYQGAMQILGNESGITRPEGLVVLSAEGLLESRPWEYACLAIRLLSPLRLLEDGRPLTRFDFSRFACSVMRRVSSLAYYYGESEFDCDFKELSCQADAVNCTEDNFCHATCGNRKMSGITGFGSFKGDFSGLMPFLVLGTYVHVGKGAAYGMGCYELIPCDP
jgi:hypothetical protein